MGGQDVVDIKEGEEVPGRLPEDSDGVGVDDEGGTYPSQGEDFFPGSVFNPRSGPDDDCIHGGTGVLQFVGRIRGDQHDRLKVGGIHGQSVARRRQGHDTCADAKSSAGGQARGARPPGPAADHRKPPPAVLVPRRRGPGKALQPEVGIILEEVGGQRSKADVRHHDLAAQFPARKEDVHRLADLEGDCEFGRRREAADGPPGVAGQATGKVDGDGPYT